LHLVGFISLLELKKVQKEEISAAFQKLYDLAEACVYANAAYFE